MSGSGEPTDVDYTKPYFTTAWYEPNHGGDGTRSFELLIPEGTPNDVYDFEFALAGNPHDGGKYYSDEHFYVQVVPEPGTFVLLGMGLCTLGLCIWRRRK